ncbi:MAG: GNAT family N-acetyltransferase [Anaeromyxobacteraceae bacterium]
MIHALSVTFREAAPAELDVLVRIDDDAATLYEEAGLDFSGPAIRAFVDAEQARWRRAAEAHRVELAVDAQGEAVGFVALGFVDGQPYVDQLSVVRRAMRRGVGRALLARALAWSERAGALWLTTYAHLPWNAPMYERAGFTRVEESGCGPELRAILREERAALPSPEQRLAMVRRPRVSGGRASPSPPGAPPRPSRT